jgi:hypothetical protein
MKAYGGVDIYIHIFLISALVGVVSFTPLPLYPRGKSPWYALDRRLGRPQSQSGRLGEDKILAPPRDSNSDPSDVQPVASRYIDCAILATSQEVIQKTP